MSNFESIGRAVTGEQVLPYIHPPFCTPSHEAHEHLETYRP